MWNLKNTIVASLLTLPMLANAATTYVVADNSPESRLCVSAAMDSRIAFLMTQKKSGKGMHYIANNIICNNLIIGEFAVQAGNIGNATRLTKYQQFNGHTRINDYASIDQQKHQHTERVVMVRGR